ncbi:hypothetical protein ACHQM5_024460 [Ranunculus cassubicifolius]
MKKSRSRRWEELNTDCLANIFERVGLDDLMLHIPLVCKSWNTVSLYPTCWKSLDFTPLQDCCMHRLELAIARSSGIATKLVLPTRFMHPLSLEFKLEFSFMQSPKEYFINIFSKLKCLKTLELESASYYFHEILGAINYNCCKDLVSFSCFGKINEGEARAIVNQIPRIKNLDLNGATISRENLMRILKGCKELESLDVSFCEGFDADDPEILKMASHIKNFDSYGSSVIEDGDDSTDDDSSDDDNDGSDPEYIDWDNEIAEYEEYYGIDAYDIDAYHDMVWAMNEP